MTNKYPNWTGFRLGDSDLAKLKQMKAQSGLSGGEIVRELIQRAKVGPRPKVALRD